MPNCACACSAEMPFEWLASWWIASNHVRSGNLLRCMTVPAVTEVCRWQPEHSQVNGLVSSSQPLQTPPGLETERRTPSATSADRFSICSPYEHNGNIWPAVNRFQQAQLQPLGAPEPTGGAISRKLSGIMMSRDGRVCRDWVAAS